MYIKSITLEGFASYRDRTSLTFVEGHNVIVGLNGSGKSNIFRAIEFVLTVKRGNEVESVKYASGGTKVRETFVELVIDNSGQMLPINDSQVVIRRSVNNSSDQYYVNNKKCTKVQVVKLLECAGLSTKYPNYVVKDYMVNQIASESDLIRLKYMEEAVGSRQFLDLLAKFKSSVMYLRLKTLMTDKHLEAFSMSKEFLERSSASLLTLQNMRKDKLAILHFINRFEMQERANKVRQLQQKQHQFQHTQDALCLNFPNVCFDIMATHLKKAKLNMELSVVTTMKKNYPKSRELYEKLISQYDLFICEWQNEKAAFDKRELDKENSKIEAGNIHSDLRNHKNELDIKQKESEEVIKKERDILVKLVKFEQKRKFLLRKESAKENFVTKQEHIQALDKDLTNLNHLSNEVNEALQNISAEIQEYFQFTQSEENKINKYEKKRESLLPDVERLHMQQQEELLLIHNIKCQFHGLNIDNAILQAKYINIYKNSINTMQSLKPLLSREIFIGCQSFDQIINFYTNSQDHAMLDSIDVREYQGRVIDLFECDTKFNKALESTAGNRLYAHVFRTSAAAEHLAKKLEDVKYPGWISMIPMDKIKSSKAIPNRNYKMLIDEIKFDKKYKNVTWQIFGNTAIVDEIDKGNVQELTSTKLNFVTLAGTALKSNGRYYIPANVNTKSQSELFKRFCGEQKALGQYTQSIESGFRQLESLLDNDLKEFEDEESWKALANNQVIYETLSLPISEWRLQKLANDKNALSDNSAIRHLKMLKYEIEVMKSQFEAEYQEDFIIELSTEDKHILKTLQENISNEQLELTEINAQAEEWKLDVLFYRLQTLMDRRYDLLLQVECIDVGPFDGQLNQLREIKAQYDTKAQEIQDIFINNNSRQTYLEKQLCEFNDAWTMKMNEKIYIEEQWHAIFRKWESIDDEIEGLIEGPNMADEDIGQLDPSPQFLAKYEQFDHIQMKQELKRINRRIETFPPVDMEAANQLALLTELLNKHELTDTEIKTFIDYGLGLEIEYHEIKSQVIRTVFEQICIHFERIFKKLVPTGRASLIITNKNNDDIMDIDDDLISHDPEDAYSGVDIKVSFTKGAEEVHMVRLSGGQKATVAIAFVFALQALAPAPFYLLDEVDHPLDTQYRKTLAQVIRELSDRAQFISCSFWPEQIEHANKIFGVKSVQAVSNVNEVTREGATAFVQGKHDTVEILK